MKVFERFKKIVTNRLFVITITYLLGITFFAILTSYAHRAGGGDDDTLFLGLIKDKSLLDYTFFRYETWSGRLVPEAFIYIFAQINILWWQITNILMYAVLTLTMYKGYALLYKKRTKSSDVTAMIFVQVLPFFMSIGAFVDASLWVTGSMNYLWPLTFATLSLYFLVKVLKKEKYKVVFTIMGLFFGFIATISQEQIGLVLILIAATLCVYLSVYKKNVRSTVTVAGFLILYIAGFAISYVSPGNDRRLAREVAQRIPDFYTVDIVTRIEYSLRWFVDAIVNQSGGLLVLLCVLLIVLLYRKKNKIVSLRTPLILILSSAVMFFMARPYVGQLFEMHAQWGIDSFSILSRVVIMYWLTVLILIPFAIMYVFRTSYGFFLSAAVLIAYAATLALVASPTMYASGLRVVYVMSYLLVGVVATLVLNLFSFSKRDVYLLVLMLVIFPSYQALGLLCMYHKNGFSLHFPWLT